MASEPFFDPFSAAEAVAAEVIEAILVEGGQRLYESYIERKSFSFASQSVSEALVAELRMCFVRYDQGPLRPPPPQEAAFGSADSEAGDEVEPTASLVNASMVSLTSAAGLGFGHSVSSAATGPVGWCLESEPPRCRIDTWARAVVPIKKKIVRHKAEGSADPRGLRGRTQKMSPGQVPSFGVFASTSSRAPSRSGPAGPTSPTAADARFEAQPECIRVNTGKPQMIPIVDEREEDEEETMLREMKEREAKRKRDEDGRLARKAAEEVEQAAKLAQVKDQMKNKQCTYDSAGNIIWIQPPALHKLPSTNPAPNYLLKKAPGGDDDAQKKMPRPPVGANTGVRRLSRQRKGEEGFTDTFKKFAAQQPSMLEAMALTPGVALAERGHFKSGSEAVKEDGKLTRKEYEAMIQRGQLGARLAANMADGDAGQADNVAAGTSASKDKPATIAPPEDASQIVPATGDEPGAKEEANGKAADVPAPRSTGVARDPKAAFKVVRGGDLGADLLPQAPEAPRPVQPPPMPRRVQMKREALGYMLSSREKMQPTTGMSRFPGCLAQPPLGATMGHGLQALAESGEEYYFPNAPAPAMRQQSGAAEPTPAAQAPSSHRQSGALVSKNPELTRRIFRALQD
eukprot:TRINITY_DN80115_c0_g1_i1.p1 TRINITY_DN80115_c0_g1~~TRINITY_DN80115_c0_g1_i1.p1  ORF type:complete len:629 (-),score=145.29 TRINITY_DN80115_c0_g1_i1:147-2033(-)